MAKLHGVVIADPAKNNISFVKVEHDHFDVTRKESGRPLGQIVSEQNELNNFPRFMPSSRTNYNINECTIPITLTINNEEIGLWRTRKANLDADVEKPQLEADKYLVDEGMNLGAYYDPKNNYPNVSFKKIDRPALRTIRSVSSRFSGAHTYAKFINYVYTNGGRDYQDRYYKTNTWVDSKGRVHLFERNFTRVWA
ncbi:MAG: hypothetical protein PHF86_07670 [Candidatus Nanoarchaeia archaeon]|jgi:hypothetical protein|nr:hypothetical protein [Candidatus Nanoarchaeia archaeon]